MKNSDLIVETSLLSKSPIKEQHILIVTQFKYILGCFSGRSEKDERPERMQDMCEVR